MSVETSIVFLNDQDPAYKAAVNGSPEQLELWEENHGPISWRPGAELICGTDEGYEETDEEYGGWIIDLKCIPAGTTHIHISRA